MSWARLKLYRFQLDAIRLVAEASAFNTVETDARKQVAKKMLTKKGEGQQDNQGDKAISTKAGDVKLVLKLPA